MRIRITIIHNLVIFLLESWLTTTVLILLVYKALPNNKKIGQ